MKPDFPTRYRFVAGKGGVGKTTLAAAHALRLADAGRDVLVVSTDPAHSLGDALLPDGAPPLGPDPRPLDLDGPGAGRLRAAELAAPAAYQRWLGERRAAFQALAERGSYLAPEDVTRLLDLPMPGVDELVGLLELVHLVRASEASPASRVVVDTAPTAHTLRLLEVPDALERLAGVLAALQEHHRAVAEAFAGRYLEDEADAVVGDLEAEARALGELVRDPERATFTWVLLPEALAVAETADALAELRRLGVTVDQVVVNRLTPPPSEPCPPCERRRRAEAAAVDEARELAAGARMLLVPELEAEPRGAGALRAVARHLESAERGESARGAAEEWLAAIREGAGPDPGSQEPDAPVPAGPPPWLDRLAPPSLRLLLLGGKGGVGKTTCAAAIATVAARARPERPVLLLSTDPAHSVGDVLEAELGDDPRPVPGAAPNLRARELDARAAFAARKERIRDALEAAFSGLARERRTSGASAPLDRAVLERMLEATPPGLDELVAVAELTDALEDGDAAGAEAGRLVVLDTAPTGHALRLLEMPELALRWDHALLSILLEYRDAIGLPAGLSQELIDLSRSLKRLRALLTDPERCRFAVVTRAGELPRRETRRLLAALTALEIAVPAVIVDAVPTGRCRRCRSAAAAAREQIEALRTEPGANGRWTILAAPAELPPPRGARTLERWAHAWTESL